MRFSDELLGYAKEFTDCPPIFLRWGALFAISSVLGRNVCMKVGSWDVFPHIWIILIGKSSSHKSTALSIAERLIETIRPDRLYASEFSEEQLLKSLSEQSHRAFVFDEALTLFTQMSKKYNAGMKAVFTTLYRKASFERVSLKQGRCRIDNAYLCIGGASTPEWMRKAIEDADADMLSGFLARFLLVPYEGKMGLANPLPPPHDAMKFSALCNSLTRFLDVTGEFSYSDDARSLLMTWYPQISEREELGDPRLSPTFEHLKNEAVHKLSILISLDCDLSNRKISRPVLAEAIGMIGYLERCWPALMESLTEDNWSRDSQRVESFIRLNGKVDRSDILRGVRGIKAQKLTAILHGLEQDTKVGINSNLGVDGRPRQVIEWFGVPKSDVN